MLYLGYGRVRDIFLGQCSLTDVVGIGRKRADVDRLSGSKFTRYHYGTYDLRGKCHGKSTKYTCIHMFISLEATFYCKFLHFQCYDL